MQLMRQSPEGFFLAHSALVTGNVTVGALSSFWFNTVVRGDVSSIQIGQRVNVQDGAVIHCDTDTPNVIEDGVSIGHGAVCHGESIGQYSLVGIRATLLAHCSVGRHCLVAAGALVPPKIRIPDGHLVMGVPAKIVRPLEQSEMDYIRWISDHYIELAQRYIRGEYAPR